MTLQLRREMMNSENEPRDVTCTMQEYEIGGPPSGTDDRSLLHSTENRLSYINVG